MSARYEEETVSLTTTNLRENICEYQNTRKMPNGSKITDRYIATYLGELLDGNSDDRSTAARIRRYKNIKHCESKTSTSMELVRKLALLYGCSAQELITGDTKHNGRDLINPIYDIKNVRWANLITALETNPEFVECLHFIFCELPKEDSKVIVKSLNTYLKLLMENSFYSTSIPANNKRSDLMTKLLQSDPFFSETNTLLLKASDHLYDGDRNKALATYLKIITEYPSKGSEVLNNKDVALKRISFLKEHWENFPMKIGEIVDSLSAFFISPEESAKETETYKDIKTVIDNYITANTT